MFIFFEVLPVFLAVCPPPTSMVASHHPAGTLKSQPEADGEPDGDSVLSVLNCALAACRRAVKVSLKPLDTTTQQRTEGVLCIIHQFWHAYLHSVYDVTTRWH